MRKIHHIEKLSLTDTTLLLQVDGEEYTFSLSNISRKLSQASGVERNTYRIMASGYGIHWPLLDEDLSIDGLLGIAHTPPSRVTETMPYSHATVA
jgi:hypothetical protein